MANPFFNSNGFGYLITIGTFAVGAIIAFVNVQNTVATKADKGDFELLKQEYHQSVINQSAENKAMKHGILTQSKRNDRILEELIEARIMLELLLAKNGIQPLEKRK